MGSAVTRYAIVNRRNVWVIEQFDPAVAKWFELGPEYENATAELAGRSVDAMVAMERNKNAEPA